MQTPAMVFLSLVSMGLMEAPQVHGHSITGRDLFSQEMPLDMAPASFDDQYAGCAEAMMAALPALNLTEFQANKVYADGWALASSQWQERQAWGPEWGLSPTRLPLRPPGFRDEHGVALLAYTSNSPLHKEFNAAVREAGRSRAHYLNHFPFKTLHFLLTEALQVLGKGQRLPRCHQVFRGVHGLRFRPAGPGATVRLGGFASASLQNVAAQHFGKDTFFGIWTCLGAPIKGYSFFPGEEEVLIPPFETFQVINASRPVQGPARIYLRALGKRSTYNCEYIKGEHGAPGSSPCVEVDFPRLFPEDTYLAIKKQASSEEEAVLTLCTSTLSIYGETQPEAAFFLSRVVSTTELVTCLLGGQRGIPDQGRQFVPTF